MDCQILRQVERLLKVIDMIIDYFVQFIIFQQMIGGSSPLLTNFLVFKMQTLQPKFSF